ncbi:hypothetical protein [Halorarius litoreus]|uniref:hypothetical protein n=1 Tax=Halorarius litoreus TaxID=2962676 RepID=UPI0020CBDABE|nr:hypothetical protein [Halorarius litoreus]
MQRRSTRRRFLAVGIGAAALTAGCIGQSPVPEEFERIGGTPSPTPREKLTDEPADLLLEPTSLSEGSSYNFTDPTTRETQSGQSVNYQVQEDGSYSHQVTIGLTRRQTIDGAVFDHEMLVETYTDEHDATVERLDFGDTGSLVTFSDEAHAIVTYRNVIVHVVSYGGPPEQAVEIARRQITDLQT